MRFIIYIVVFFTVVSLVSASEVDYGDKSTVTSTVTISNSFTIVPTSSSYALKYVNVTLSNYPKNDYRQSVSKLTTIPQASIGNIVSYYYDSYGENYDLKLTAQVLTTGGFIEVQDKNVFPVENIGSELYLYTQPTDIIDVSSEIKNLASELIGDKTDLYEIEYVFAEYVRKNIAYDLGSLTSEADQKSSWVLTNKRGVCDELTNLFISLNRASGIPARFVSGLSYTNLDEVFGDNWIPHAWAEVYYPGVGWVPYDVTYGQYGFIDAGHIKLSHDAESGGSSIDYSYLGNNIKLVPGEVDMKVNVLDFGENSISRYNFDAKIHTREVGFGSYDMISVFVENNMPYYQVADLYLAETEGIYIIEESKETVLNKTVHRKQVLLRPKESKTVYWLVRVDNSLSSGYAYTFPITVYNTYNESSTTFIYSRKDYSDIDFDYFKKLLSSIDESTNGVVNTYSKNIILECIPSKTELYADDNLDVNCLIDNRGDKSFNNVNICLDDECVVKPLNVEKLNLSYNKKFDSEGIKSLIFKIYNDEFIKTSYITINVLDKPKISIADLSSPEIVKYSDAFNLNFRIVKESKSVPKNFKLFLLSETNKAEWTFEELDSDKSFTIKSSGESLKPNDNNYKILATYEDDKGNTYSVEKTFIIESDATFFENILLYMNVLGNTISSVLS